MFIPYRVRRVLDGGRRIVQVLRGLSGPSHVLERRQLAWELLAGEVDTLTFTRNGTTWTIYASDNVGKHLFLRGEFGLASAGMLLKWLAARPVGQRPTIVNVGANIGSSCIPLAQMTGKRVLAIEPVRRTYEQLVLNIEQNALGTLVTPIRAAVTKSRCTVDLITPTDTGKSEIKASKQGFATALGTSVGQITSAEGVPLDDLIERPQDIALVWSDTQGFETSVIESGATLWAAGVPLWVEVWPDGLEVHGGVQPFLAACRRHFRSFILDQDFEEHGPLREQPVTALEDVIREITVGTRQHRRSTTDVLLIPDERQSSISPSDEA